MNNYIFLFLIHIYAKLVLFIENMVYVEPTCVKQLQYGSRVFLPEKEILFLKIFCPSKHESDEFTFT